MKNIRLSVAVAVGLASLSNLSLAHEAGDFILRGGVASVQPDATPHGTLDALNADVDNGTALGITAAYMVSDVVGIELLVASPFKHNITSNGRKIGEASQLPPTLSLQYWPALELGGFQPYVGVGVNYTNFFEEESSLGKLKLDDSWGIAWQVGFDYQVQDQWLVNASIWNLDIESDATLNGASIGSIDIDPWVYMLGVGYRF